ncbi:MAG: ergothioneine biosynthesis glutamate--cysteine ligase EgtA [Acidimicrobiia bacterium]|jgi:glutamate--cysteine ligase
MPSPHRVLPAAEARHIVAERGFAPSGNGSGNGTGDAPPRFGAEIEWCTVDLADPTRPADFDAVCRAAAMATIPHRSRITYEPGGQIELSSRPLPRLEAIPALAADAASLGRALGRAGIGMVAIGLEPGPRRDRFLRSPRYDAMEAYFDAGGVAGRTMMRSTAALQLNLDLGAPDETERRWDLVHALGPVLAATFANSPFWDGRPSGWKSTRLAVWNRIDPGRTQPVANGVGCREAWARYALDADVMLVRRSDTEHVAVPPGLTFAAWIEHGHPAGWPTVEDLEYHLTTLFPPVRPRGWFELRMVDALPAPWWRVAAAVGTVLVDDPAASSTAAAAAAPVRDRWTDAARHGLADPAIAAAARTCFHAAAAALDRSGADAATVDAAAEYADRYVDRSRTPADDLLDAYERGGTLLPRPDNA